jgi:hypothetical protein
MLCTILLPSWEAKTPPAHVSQRAIKPDWSAPRLAAAARAALATPLASDSASIASIVSVRTMPRSGEWVASRSQPFQGDFPLDSASNRAVDT